MPPLVKVPKPTASHVAPAAGAAVAIAVGVMVVIGVARWMRPMSNVEFGQPPPELYDGWAIILSTACFTMPVTGSAPRLAVALPLPVKKPSMGSCTQWPAVRTTLGEMSVPEQKPPPWNHTRPTPGCLVSVVPPWMASSEDAGSSDGLDPLQPTMAPTTTNSNERRRIPDLHICTTVRADMRRTATASVHSRPAGARRSRTIHWRFEGDTRTVSCT